MSQEQAGPNADQDEHQKDGNHEKKTKKWVSHPLERYRRVLSSSAHFLSKAVNSNAESFAVRLEARDRRPPPSCCDAPGSNGQNPAPQPDDVHTAGAGPRIGSHSSPLPTALAIAEIAGMHAVSLDGRSGRKSVCGVCRTPFAAAPQSTSHLERLPAFSEASDPAGPHADAGSPWCSVQP